MQPQFLEAWRRCSQAHQMPWVHKFGSNASTRRLLIPLPQKLTTARMFMDSRTCSNSPFLISSQHRTRKCVDIHDATFLITYRLSLMFYEWRSLQTGQRSCRHFLMFVFGLRDLGRGGFPMLPLSSGRLEGGLSASLLFLLINSYYLAWRLLSPVLESYLSFLGNGLQVRYMSRVA